MTHNWRVVSLRAFRLGNLQNAAGGLPKASRHEVVADLEARRKAPPVAASGATPAEIVEKLNKEVNAALADPKMKVRLADLGVALPAGSGGFAAIQTVAPSFGVELTPIGVQHRRSVRLPDNRECNAPRGTIFQFTLPARRERTSTAVGSVEEPTVFVVDDDESLRACVSEKLVRFDLMRSTDCFFLMA